MRRLDKTETSEIKLLIVYHVAVVSNIVGGSAVTNVVRTCSPTPLLLFEQ